MQFFLFSTFYFSRERQNGKKNWKMLGEKNEEVIFFFGFEHKYKVFGNNPLRGFSINFPLKFCFCSIEKKWKKKE